VRWADEILVVDMHSDDATVAVAEELGCRVFSHERTGYVEPARNFAIEQATGDWILVLDADERVSSGLAQWIAQTLPAIEATAVRIPRRNFYGDVWVTCCGWFPDEQLRLFRRGKVRYSDRIHRAPQIDGETVTLPLEGDAYLKHLAFSTIESRVEKINKYAVITGETMAREGKQISAASLGFRTLHAFVAAYYFQKGWKFGILGVVLAWERAFATFLKYAKLWEINKSAK
ncbi:MAG TPA: glycosyltransferase family 2 protein, partial [Abditibacteriaceae bacterium]